MPNQSTVDNRVLTAVEARRITEQIKVGVEALWELVSRAYMERAWTALGYSSWDDYCTREFGASRLRLPREEREEVVCSLRESGLSIRAIASATGAAYDTVRKDVNQFRSPEPSGDVIVEEPTHNPYRPAGPATVTGIDGKNYSPSKPPTAPRRTAITDNARILGLDLQRITERIEKFANDDRFSKNRNEIEPHIRYQLQTAIAALTDLHKKFTPTKR